MKSILYYLDRNEKLYGTKIAYSDEEASLSWKEIREIALRVASGILRRLGEGDGSPVVLSFGKSPKAVGCFLGVALTGRPYVFLDESLPEKRSKAMLSLLEPELIISNDLLEVFLTEEMEEERVRERAESLTSYHLYISFTSSTTGAPKGVLTSFASVSHYVTELISNLGFHDTSIMANQAAFHFDAYLKDVYVALFTGGSAYLIKKELFLSPEDFVRALLRAGVNTLTWTASAYRILHSFGLSLPEVFRNQIRLITFGSEVMRTDVLSYLRKNFPNARIFQLYGTTETTGMTAYYEVKRDFLTGEKIPLGKPFYGMDLRLYNGEIIITGKGLSVGYYKNKELTELSFREVDGERVYFTGDMGEESEEGILFLGRKQRVIKRAGYMLSLDKLEDRIRVFPEILEAAAVFIEEQEKICVYYSGKMEAKEIRKRLEKEFPKAILPSVIKKVERLPRLENGKVNYRGIMDGNLDQIAYGSK